MLACRYWYYWGMLIFAKPSLPASCWSVFPHIDFLIRYSGRRSGIFVFLIYIFKAAANFICTSIDYVTVLTPKKELCFLNYLSDSNLFIYAFISAISFS